MQTSEAMEVLNIQKLDLSNEVVLERFKKMYDLNDPIKGGSFYLQSKIFRAKEALEHELNPDAEEEDENDEESKAKKESDESIVNPTDTKDKNYRRRTRK